MEKRVAWAITAASTALALASLALLAADYLEGHRQDLTLVSEVPAAVVFCVVGALIVGKLPGHRVGWACIGVGAAYGLTRFTSEYAVRALLVAPGTLPGGVLAAWLTSWLDTISWPLTALLLLWFPGGRATSRRWGMVGVVAAAAGAASVVVHALAPIPLQSDAGEVLVAHNPLAVAAIPASLAALAFNTAYALLLLAAVALVLRLRTASGASRQQLKILVFVCALILVEGVVLLPLYESNPNPSGALAEIEAVLYYTFTALFMVGVPAAIGLAILRYRLYDIDLVINRTLLFGSLAVFITGVYVGIVVGLSQLVHVSSQGNLALSIVATIVVAVAFEPARRQMQRVANRVVYGHRASPYEVLADFGTRVSSLYPDEDVLRRTARVLAEGLGAAASVVFLRRGDALQPAAIWPPGEIDVRAIMLVGGRLAEGPGGLRALEVRHQGELLGALGVIRPRGESLSPVEERLLSDLAAQTGVVMHNVRLKAELEERLRQLSRQEAELRRSRERIVAAQDAERRRLERDIHDGAQQHLVALAVKIRLARTLLDRNPEKAAGMVDQLTTEVGVAERTLSDLARGIYPASLRDRGLVQALRSEAETLSLRADVRTGELGRYDQEVEAGVYFLCLEALQNVAKHAPGARVQVRVEESGDELRFSVTDDGPGFDPRSVSAGSGLGNIADRAATLGGGARVEAAPGRGVTVSGSIPVRRKEAVPA